MKFTYPDRFIVYEHAPVHTIELADDHVTLSITLDTTHTAVKVDANNVVLCTNGFNKFTIINKGSNDIDTSFHANVSGLV
jgi:hypothetical protein